MSEYQYAEFVIFHATTGQAVNWYVTKSATRCGMRVMNKNAGWERISRTWTNGAEYEWCYNKLEDRYEHGPYALADWDTWATQFNPEIMAKNALATM
jgi:hypothetical protein